MAYPVSEPNKNIKNAIGSLNRAKLALGRPFIVP